MPVVAMNMVVTQKGTLFQMGARAAAVSRAQQQMNDVLAKETFRRVQDKLARVLKHPTGYYQSQIRITNLNNYRQVDDNNVVYGGWLEGVSSRNRATRFKGYHTFRTVRQSINRDKYTLVGNIMLKLRKDLNK